MAEPSEIDWQSGDKSGLVSIGTHKLFAKIAGPPRKAGDPLVVVVTGHGSSISSWPSVLRSCSRFARIIAYDRTGLGKSEKPPSPSPRTGEAIAEELSTLLDAMHLAPPYVLITQSYGGVLARLFLALRPHDVVGLCLLDANQERTYRDRYLDDSLLEAMLEGIDYYEVSGMKKHHRLTDEDLAAMAVDDAGADGEYVALEKKDYDSSAEALAAHKQFDRQVLGRYPVSVVRANTIRELNAILKAATEKGNGTEEQRAEVTRQLGTFEAAEEKLQREQLRLSSRSRYFYAEHSGHNVQVYAPELVAEEIRWILDSQPESSEW
ncbi:hypothetical protein MMC34_000620 [Xylographa carneopallida]|nr:hypothetical protein [Xylographa carneopallida]